ncbi:hypothetical protein [uncultured Sphingomonas sp.]|uniref:hypothetical protein n=1 Tax=uncultured Sphingomonas sp. TaxID=158754 RepID=UPI0025DAE543|nr:hypothetical protein [uncultured Sphingomonas sp.]
MKASLQRLGVDRVDILLMHDLDRATHGAEHVRYWHDATVGGGFRAMERLRSERLVDAFRMGVNQVAVCESTLAHADLDRVLPGSDRGSLHTAGR